MICNYCNKTFSNKSNLIKHQKTKSCVEKQTELQTEELKQELNNIKLELENAQKQIKELKEENIKLQTRLEIYSEQKQDHPSIHNTTNNITNNNTTIINQLQVLDLNPNSIFFFIIFYESLSLFKKNNVVFEPEVESIIVKESREKIGNINTDQNYLRDLIET
jgi:hypothetical protein